MGQEMQTLDTLYTKAKEELANSYADHIGGFYEGLGQTGAVQEMRKSVLAASCAKDLSQQLKHPAWDTYDTKANDANLDKALAQQYHSLANGLEDAGISEGMSTLLKDSFVPFLDHYLDALDEKIDQNRARVASKPWQAGLIPTKYIHREEVYRAFALFS